MDNIKIIASEANSINSYKEKEKKVSCVGLIRVCTILYTL
jgi:hypothetical protein